MFFGCFGGGEKKYHQSNKSVIFGEAEKIFPKNLLKRKKEFECS